MNTHGARDMTAEPAWHGRLRVGLLALALLAGLIVATIERFRPEAILPLWNPANETLGAFTRGVSRSTHGAVQRVRHMDALLEADQRLESVRRELTQARLEQQLLQEQIGRLERLVGNGAWAAPPQLRFLPADVTAIHTQEGSAEATINRGTSDGVQPRDPVVALGGLVGVVRTTGADHARVQTLSDPGSVVGVVTREGRARGVVRGRGRDKPLEFVTEDEIQAIEPGAELITSGFENSIYPKGIQVGTISGVDLNVYGIPYGIVRPSVTFGTIEEVLLVMPAGRPLGSDSATTPTTSSLGRYTIAMPSPAGAGASATTSLTADADAVGSATLALETIVETQLSTPTLMGPPDAGDLPTSATLTEAEEAPTAAKAPIAKPARGSSTRATQAEDSEAETPLPVPANTEAEERD